MEVVQRKIRPETPPEGSRVDTLRRFFDGDPASRTKIDLDAEDSRSSEGSGPATRPRRKDRGRPRKDHGGLPKGTPITPIPSLPAAMGTDETAGIATSPRAARG